MTDNKHNRTSTAGTPGLSRREALATLGMSLLGASAWAEPAADLRAQATRNLRLGIVSGVYGALPLEEAVGRIRADGFSNVLTDFRFADVRFDPLAPDWAAADKITACFARHEIHVASLYGYYNLVDPQADRRQRSEARMQFLIQHWKRLGTPLISTETGTFNQKSEWLEAPENATEEGYRACRAAVEKLVRAAEKTGASICLEVYWRNVIDGIERAERLLREVSSPALKLVMDPCNYYRPEDLPRMQPLLREMFQRLGRHIALAHAKDVKASATAGTDLPAAGQGVLDYPLYLRLLAELDRPLDLVVEHLTLDDVARARDFVRAQLEMLASGGR